MIVWRKCRPKKVVEYDAGVPRHLAASTSRGPNAAPATGPATPLLALSPLVAPAGFRLAVSSKLVTGSVHNDSTSAHETGRYCHNERCQAQVRAYLSLQPGRAGRKPGGPGPSQQDPAANPAASRPERGGIEMRDDYCRARRRQRAVSGHVQEPLGPTTPGHRPTILFLKKKCQP